LAKAAVDIPKQATARDAGFRSEMNAFKVPVYWEKKSRMGQLNRGSTPSCDRDAELSEFGMVWRAA
jgi:hypothetical protein